jgi:hypothetical protein
MLKELELRRVPCQTCKGEGMLWVFDGMDSSVKSKCFHCNGKGTVNEPHEVYVTRLLGVIDALVSKGSILLCDVSDSCLHCPSGTAYSARCNNARIIEALKAVEGK